MVEYSLSKSFEWQGEVTDKVRAVMRMFGLGIERLTGMTTEHKCDLKICEGDIVYFSGPSGAGKSVLLRELEKTVPEEDRINLSQIKLPADRAVIDCIEGDFLKGLGLLSTAGLNDVFCVLNRPSVLSEGQQWRFRLAMALGAGKKFVFADEFCSNLDRITAAVVSYNVRKFADKHKVTFLLAGSRDDFLADLRPEVLVVKNFEGKAEVINKDFLHHPAKAGQALVHRKYEEHEEKL